MPALITTKEMIEALDRDTDGTPEGAIATLIEIMRRQQLDIRELQNIVDRIA